MKRKFNKEIKPFLWILDTVRNHDYFPSKATIQDWEFLVDIHYKYVKKSKGTKECYSCKKYFKICYELNNFKDSLSK